MAKRKDKAMTEWDLLVTAEGIEEGDTLRVELDQRIEDMVYVGMEAKSIVALVDRHGTRRLFKTTTLEGWGSSGYIMGISKNQLKLSDLRRV